jgi:hypothetical protein
MSILHESQEQSEKEGLKIFAVAELVVFENFLKCGIFVFQLRTLL